MHVVVDLRTTVGGTFNTPDVTGERPIIRASNVRTTVSVPDGGTLLIGGLGDIVTNETTEGIIPLLGEIPIIGRSFENRQHVQDQTKLIFMITPTIVVQEEE